MMTSQAGGKPSGTGCTAGPAIPAGAPTRAWPASQPADFDQSRGYEPSPRGYGDRPARSREGQPTERLQPARPGGRNQDAPEPVGARVPRSATASRRPSVGT